MSDRNARRGRLFSVESIAGWVFADLLLVLFLVGLGSAIAYTPPKPEPKPKEEKPKILGMKTQPAVVNLTVPADGLTSGAKLSAQQARGLCRALHASTRELAGEKSALVLIFGGASEVSPGQNVARAIGSQLSCAAPTVFARKVPTRAFWDGSLPLGQARLEVFLFLQEKSQPAADADADAESPVAPSSRSASAPSQLVVP